MWTEGPLKSKRVKRPSLLILTRTDTEHLQMSKSKPHPSFLHLSLSIQPFHHILRRISDYHLSDPRYAPSLSPSNSWWRRLIFSSVQFPNTITASFDYLFQPPTIHHLRRSSPSSLTVDDKGRIPSPHGGRGALPSEGGSPSDLLFLAGGGPFFSFAA